MIFKYKVKVKQLKVVTSPCTTIRMNGTKNWLELRWRKLNFSWFNL
jgi:hypothetical protein